MSINRFLRDSIISDLNSANKVIILYGARQVGKTTLVKQIISEIKYKTLSINADQQKFIDVLSGRDLDKMKGLVYGFDLLFIDEAQRVPEIGLNLKILHDEMPELRILVTGSSSFDLANLINEPLTGRKKVYELFPFSQAELAHVLSPFDLGYKLDDLLIFGAYPEVYTTISQKKKYEILNEIMTSYLYKDIFEMVNLKHSSGLRNLLKLLAYQVGSEVSVNELSNSLGISREAIERYITLLEKSFIIFRLSGFSRNLRKEVVKKDKIYFYDTGIRNIIIDNLNPLNSRNDTGQLWENFIIAERIKKLSYQGILATPYFWRTYTGAELDYVEETGGKLMGYEIKYSKTKDKAPHTWLETYENSEFHLINKDNYLEFLL